MARAETPELNWPDFEVTCAECGKDFPLADIHLRVRCDCHPDDECEHGICDVCLDEYMKDDRKKTKGE